MDGTVGYKPAESSGAKWLAIINPSAAGGSAAAEWPLIDRLLRRAGITAEAVFTAHRYHAVELTVAAVNDGIRHIIAVGGDTTLHEVVNGLFIQRAVRPEEITLGIIPTGNCRIAGIPKTYPEAVSAIASGYVSLYHIATVSYSQSHYRQERLMAGEAGMGLYAMLAARFNRLREEGKATVPRRLWAVLESILSYRAPQVRIYADGQSVYCGRAAGATLVISGEFPEGHFELTLQPGGCRMTCLRLFYTLFRGKPYDLPGSLHWRGREIRIETDNIFAVEADGDPLGDTPLGFRITRSVQIQTLRTVYSAQLTSVSLNGKSPAKTAGNGSRKRAPPSKPAFHLQEIRLFPGDRSRPGGFQANILSPNSNHIRTPLPPHLVFARFL